MLSLSTISRYHRNLGLSRGKNAPIVFCEILAWKWQDRAGIFPTGGGERVGDITYASPRGCRRFSATPPYSDFYNDPCNTTPRPATPAATLAAPNCPTNAPQNPETLGNTGKVFKSFLNTALIALSCNSFIYLLLSLFFSCFLSFSCVFYL